MIKLNEFLDLSNLQKKSKNENKIKTLDDILEQIKKAEKIVILTHESPDGDAIGSSLATKLLLEKLGKKSDVIIPEYSRLFKFLPETDTIIESSKETKYDLAISVDCADLKRLEGKEYFEKAKNTIVIDHHGSNNMFGDINFVNPASPACCEVLAGLFGYFKIDISIDIGTCLLTGIITDTGGFRHTGITPETFEFTADLIRLGVDETDIYKRTLNTKTKPSFELSKIAIDRMELLEDGKISFTYLTKEDEEQTGAEPGDHEGVVEIGRDIEGVEVSIFLRQKEKGKEGYKISLRSGKTVNVSDVCMMFGGGGHPGAAGAFAQGSVEEIKEKLVKEIKKSIK